jgi:hypothetical protein
MELMTIHSSFPLLASLVNCDDGDKETDMEFDVDVDAAIGRRRAESSDTGMTGRAESEVDRGWNGNFFLPE